MQSLENLERVKARSAAAVSEVADLQSRVNALAKQWQDAVIEEDAKTEMSVAKDLASARAALDLASTRLPLLAQAVTNALRDAAPGHAKDIEPKLLALNEQAATIALQVIEDYGRALQGAKTINALHKEHANIQKEVVRLAQDAKVPIPAISHSLFRVDMSGLNFVFTPDWATPSSRHLNITKDRLIPEKRAPKSNAEEVDAGTEGANDAGE